MIHEPHLPHDRQASLCMLLGIPVSTIADALRTSVLPLPTTVSRLVVNDPGNEYHGRSVSLVSQKNRTALVHVEDHIHLIIDCSKLCVLPGWPAPSGDCA
jgi:hypothetical protein